jgi:MYXO-CTERM domain-containing protein
VTTGTTVSVQVSAGQVGSPPPLTGGVLLLVALAATLTRRHRGRRTARACVNAAPL